MSLRVSVVPRKLPLVKLFFFGNSLQLKMSSGDESYSNTSSWSAVELLQLAGEGENLLIHLFSPIKLKKM